MTPQIEAWVVGANIAGVASMSAAAVLEAGRRSFDLLGILVVALAASLGGGSLRDMLLDRPVFWVADQRYLLAAIVAALVTFCVARIWRLPVRLFVIADAFGLALFTVAGAQAAIASQAPWLVVSLMGVMTGAAGGLVRDVLCNQTPLIMLSGELYASASWLGALLLVAVHEAGFGPDVASVTGGMTVLILRLGAMRYHWHLPVFSARE